MGPIRDIRYDGEIPAFSSVCTLLRVLSMFGLDKQTGAIWSDTYLAFKDRVRNERIKKNETKKSALSK